MIKVESGAIQGSIMDTAHKIANVLGIKVDGLIKK
ncbi:MAG: hypothetical protein KAR00_03410 [Candidatus Pacebacteria bacterium]|nr:hypothetical protein [Candidatus Paceibacterota bacterium]